MLAMRRLLISAAALLAVVAVLGLLVGHEVPQLFEVDRVVGAALRANNGDIDVLVLQVLTAPGLTAFRAVILIPIAIVLAIRGRRRMAGFVLLAGSAVGPLTLLLKEVVGRVRPTTDDPLVMATGLSFPSGHSSGAATLSGILLVVLWPIVARRWRPWLIGGSILLAMCVAWTRIALGVHYLSDTVGGLALGSAVVLLSMVVFGVAPKGILPTHGPTGSAERGRAPSGPHRGPPPTDSPPS